MPALTERQPLILFDGVCNLCQSSVQFVIRNDSAEQFRFAALQSDIAQSILREYSYAHDELSSMLVLIEGELYRESRAALEIAKRLDWPWPLCYYLAFWVPAFIADRIYRFVGKRRYRWFGKKEECWIPDAGLAARFVDQAQETGTSVAVSSPSE